MFAEEFGARLRNAMESQKVTQQRMADACGITPGAVSSWWSGRSLPTIENLVAISRILGTTIDWLCGVESGDMALEKSEKRLLKFFRGCDEQGKRDIIDSAADTFFERNNKEV